MLDCKLDQLLTVLRCVRVDDDVCVALEGSVAECADFLECGAMGMHNPFPSLEGTPGEVLLTEFL
jgi:hypothetical protein